MVKIFGRVRAHHNESLLDVLGAVVIAEKPISILSIKKMLGKKAYSGIHKNVVFLEDRDFLKSERKDFGQKGRLCDVTLKGALASLFSSTLTLDPAELLERWRQKDWGPRYYQPFKNIKDVSELKRLVETLCLNVGSLENVSEEILARNLRNPEDLFSLITDGVVRFEKKVDEAGKYVETIPYIPGTVVTNRLLKQKNVQVVLTPEKETGRILFDFLADSHYKKKIEVGLQLALQTIARDLEKGEGGVFSHYFTHLRTFVLVATLPEKVASLLKYPEQVLEFTKNSYFGIVKPFLCNDEFVGGHKDWFIFRGLKYDPKRRDLSPLSEDEIKEKARKILKNYRNVGS